MSHVVCYTCGKPGQYSRDCRSKKKERDSDSDSSRSRSSDGDDLGSQSGKSRSERPCHFHKRWAKPPNKCEKGDECEFMHGKAEPKKKGTPGTNHTRQNALYEGSLLVIAVLGNILPTQSLMIPESSKFPTLRTNGPGAREVK